MARIKPTPYYLNDTRRLWQKAKGRKEQRRVIDEARKPFGYSYAQFTRLLHLKARKRSLSKKELERIEEKKAYAQKLYDFLLDVQFDQPSFTKTQAYQLLVEDKQIPVEVSLKSIDALARKIGLSNEYCAPAIQFHGRSEPMHLVQMDYSKSRFVFFNPQGRLFLQSKAKSKAKESRLYIAAAVDWYSRVCWFQYYQSAGESTAFVRDAMLDAFAYKEHFDPTTGEIGETRKILQGIPRELYMDRGKGNRSDDIISGLQKHQVKPIIGSVEYDIKGRRTNRSNKKARGLVERFIRDFKDRFENNLWGNKVLGKVPPEFTLEWLNGEALAFCERTNERQHPLRKTITRWSAYEHVLGTLRYPTTDSKKLFGGSLTRLVRNRLIQGETRNQWFIAPLFIHDGTEVEMIFSGHEAYLFHEGQLILLEAQRGSKAHHDRLQREQVVETFGDLELTEQLATELDLQSDGRVTLRMLPDELEDDLKEFSERARTLDEIKEKAAYFIMVARGGNPPAAAKIIPFVPLE